MTTREAPFKVGDKIRDHKLGRSYEVTFVNPNGINCGVFSAKPIDGNWAWWGGPFPKADEFTFLEPQAKVAAL